MHEGYRLRKDTRLVELLSPVNSDLTSVKLSASTIDIIENNLSAKLCQYFQDIRLPKSGNEVSFHTSDIKDAIRLSHRSQRKAKYERSAEFVKRTLPRLLPYFASGQEVVPERLSPRIHLVVSGSKEADLFRLATLTWSIPVSEGFGRRMRFIVWDDANGKLIGIIALGDPVFNLKVRDGFVGWTAADRKERLVHVMDAYVLGAVPPYNMLLGGKLVACLVRTREIRDHFRVRYNKNTGIISGKRKSPELVMVTTSSALGRSSIYNRLHLNGIKYFKSVGYTVGYGHFHISNQLFEEMREYLKLRGHKYYGGNRYGNGPNWKFRVIRATLDLLGIERDLLCHGIKREVFVCQLASNAERILRGEEDKPSYDHFLSATEVSELVLDRWICPRARSKPNFVDWQRDHLTKLFPA